MRRCGSRSQPCFTATNDRAATVATDATTAMMMTAVRLLLLVTPSTISAPFWLRLEKLLLRVDT